MRRAMIGVGVVLAVLELSPLVFGQRMASTEANASVPHPATPLPAPARAQRTAATPLENCDQHYVRARASCSPANRTCALAVTEHRDLCEATGFWNGRG